ncbi:hypothetical protein IPR32_22145 [Xanthomonas perforans]|nr:hypothetical protein [Xanthomonas perforans]
MSLPDASDCAHQFPQSLGRLIAESAVTIDVHFLQQPAQPSQFIDGLLIGNAVDALA